MSDYHSARSRTSITDERFPALGLIANAIAPQESDLPSAIDALIARSLEAVEDVAEREALRALLVRGEEWSSAADRGSDAAASLGISYDGLRRRNREGRSRMDQLIDHMASLIDDKFGDLIVNARPHRAPVVSEGVSERAVVFLSYSHSDDKHVGGLISNIRDSLVDEFRFQTGRDIDVFQDRSSIDAGENWSRKIQETLEDTSLLLAIMTPSYLASDACREEALRFVEVEKKKGRDDLIIPAYLATIPESSQDDLARKLFAHHWFDIRDLRFVSRDSPEFGKMIEGLTRQVVNALARSPEESLGTALGTSGGDSAESGLNGNLLERVAGMELAVPRLVRRLFSISEEITGMGDDASSVLESVHRSEERGQGAVGRLSAIHKLARMIEPRAEKVEAAGRQATEDLREMHQGVQALVSMVNREDAAEIQQMQQLRSVLVDMRDASSIAWTQISGMIESTRQLQTLSGRLVQPFERFRRGVSFVEDVPGQIQQWIDALDAEISWAR